MKKNSFKLQSVRSKILILFIGISTLSITTITVRSIQQSSDALLKKSFDQLEAVQMIKVGQIKSFFESCRKDIELATQSDNIRKAITLLVKYHHEMGLKAEDAFDISSPKKAVTRNYKSIYEEINTYLSKYCTLYTYHNVFLICQPHGHIMYTWAKEDDLGTNLKHGKYRNTHLAEAWEKARSINKPVITDMKPYEPSKGAPVMFIACPIIQNGERLGVMAFQISLDDINKIMQERAGMGRTGETYLVGEDKRMRSDSYLDKTGHSLESSFNGTIEKNGVDTAAVNEAFNGKNGRKIITDYNGNRVLSCWNSLEIDGFSWVVIAEMGEAEVKEPINKTIRDITIFALILIALVIILTTIFSRYISKPIQYSANFANIIASGDLQKSVDPKYLNMKDEIGVLCNAVNNMVIKLKDIIETVKTSAGNVSDGSGQLSSAAEQFSQGASEQAASVEEILSSVEEMSVGIKQNSDNASQTEKIALKSAKDAKEGGKAVMKTVSAMKQIAEKISIIQDIARQTNLLSLNASIEAARAGEAGKGFAVVAAQVQKLADRSQSAAEEINDLSKSSVEIAEQAGTMLEKLVPDIQKTAELVSEINAASAEQNIGAQQINNAVQRLNSVVQQNASAAEESSATAEQLSFQAEQLKETIFYFQTDQNNTDKTAIEHLKINQITQPTITTKQDAEETTAQNKRFEIYMGEKGRRDPNDDIELF